MKLSLETRRLLVLLIAFGLIIWQQWRVLVFLLFIYLLYGTSLLNTDDETRGLFAAQPGGEYLYRVMQALEELRGRYPDKKIDDAKRRTLNQILYQIP